MSEVVFESPAREWNDAFPIGNGFLGGMVFGGVAHERIQVNEDTVWSGGPLERVNPDCRAHLDEIRALLFDGKIAQAERLAARAMYGTYLHPRHYQTLGDVWIDFESADDSCKMGEYLRALDLNEAVGRISCGGSAGETRTFFASNPAHVLAYRIDAASGETLSFDVRATRKDNRPGRGSSYCDGCMALDASTIRLWGTNGGRDGISFELLVRVVAEGGTQERMGSRIVVAHASAATVYITGRTSVRSEDAKAWCLDVLDEAAKRPFAELLAEHVNDYRSLFDRCTLRLGPENEADPKALLSTPARLQALRAGETDLGLVSTYFDFGRYLLISSSRAGSMPANLQGVWNGEFEPAWGSKYTININIQMNYWLAEQTGLGELQLQLFEHMRRMLPRGQEVARKMYGARGYCCHHNTDIWGDCAPADANRSATPWPLGAAWLSLHIVEHYRYTKSKAFLDEYLNLLREAVLFLVDYLVQDPDGRWVCGPSSSPENTYRTATGAEGNLCMGPSMDTQIVRELFSGYLEIAEELQLDDALVPILRDRLAGLPPIEVGKLGTIREWAEDYDEVDPGHRHVAHLFALYPGTQIRFDTTPELARAAKATLKRRLSFGGGHTGWSKAWTTLLFARLHDSAAAWENLCGLLANSTMDNLFDTHPPFQIDGNFGGATAVLEMLVQDYGSDVYLLPALPAEIPEGSVRGVRLMSGAVLDMSWSAGKLCDYELEPLRPGSVTLHFGNESASVRF